MRKIAVVTGTRAEYGLLYWIIKEIHEDPELELQLIVTGMHLSTEFGLTARVIEADGFPVADRVEMLLSADTETAVSASMGLGMIGFANTYSRLSPDIIVLLGDRFEIFSAAAAAVPFRIPIAHIHGGESTEGAMDESFRHAITKMSHLHFASTEMYRNRIIQMGEKPGFVFCFGAPGLDHIHKSDLMGKAELFKDIGIVEQKKVGIVTYHPATHEKGQSREHLKELLSALGRFPELFWIITYPNADMGGRMFIKIIEEFCRQHANHAKAFISLGQKKYLSLLKYASVMVGNSSSGIIEAPSFNLPVINIGLRQEGRVRAKNVIDIHEVQEKKISAAVERALSPAFIKTLKNTANPYGPADGQISRNIVRVLKKTKLDKALLVKHFMNLSAFPVR